MLRYQFSQIDYRLSRVPIKILAGIFFFPENDRLILKFIWEFKGSKIVKTILKNNVGGLKLPEFKTYYKTTVMKTLGKSLNRHFIRDDIQINKSIGKCGLPWWFRW